MRTLDSFGQLRELGMIRVNLDGQPYRNVAEFSLNLPMLDSLHIEELSAISHLKLDAPKLQKVELRNRFSNLVVELVYVESVETLIILNMDNLAVKRLKNLKYFYVGHYDRIGSTFLAGLEQLKEIHLSYRFKVRRLFEQKQRYHRTDLKIYLRGLLLSGPDDGEPDIFTGEFDAVTFRSLTEYASRRDSRLVDIPHFRELSYEVIKPVAGTETAVLKRFTSLFRLDVPEPVEDVEHFLALLKNFNNIVELEFAGIQPQSLFDRLPDHCNVQRLTVWERHEPSFSLRLKHLNYIFLRFSIDAETIRKALEELPFISDFECFYNGSKVRVRIEQAPKRYHLLVAGEAICLANLNSAIEFILNPTPSKQKDNLESLNIFERFYGTNAKRKL